MAFHPCLKPFPRKPQHFHQMFIFNCANRIIKMSNTQASNFTNWSDYWDSFDKFVLTLQNTNREHIASLFKEAKLYVNGMTDGWFGFTEAFEAALLEHRNDLTDNEADIATTLLNYVKIPLINRN